MVLLSGVATSVGGSSWRGRRPVTMASPAGAGSELSVVSTVVVSDTVDSGASGSMAVVPGSVVVEVVSDVVGWVVSGAAVVALRATGEYALVTFAGDVEVVRPMAASDPSPDVGAGVVDAVLALRGHGTTDVAGALLAGAAQLARSRAGRRVGVLLSDARATEPGDVVAAGRAYDELVIIAPDDDADEARSVGAAIGARVVTWTGPSQIPVVLRDALA